MPVIATVPGFTGLKGLEMSGLGPPLNTTRRHHLLLSELRLLARRPRRELTRVLQDESRAQVRGAQAACRIVPVNDVWERQVGLVGAARQRRADQVAKIACTIVTKVVPRLPVRPSPAHSILPRNLLATVSGCLHVRVGDPWCATRRSPMALSVKDIDLWSVQRPPSARKQESDELSGAESLSRARNRRNLR